MLTWFWKLSLQWTNETKFKKYIQGERSLKWRRGLSSLCPILGPTLLFLRCIQYKKQQKSAAKKQKVVAAVAATAMKIIFVLSLEACGDLCERACDPGGECSRVARRGEWRVELFISRFCSNLFRNNGWGSGFEDGEWVGSELEGAGM